MLAYQFERFSARALLDQLVRCQVTTFCAPPTVWRMLIQEDLRRWPVGLREVVGAGEPLNPEVIERVKAAWGIDDPGWLRADRDHGADRQSARTAFEAGLHGPAAARLRGRPAGRRRQRGDEGEICLDLQQRPVGLMQAYLDDPDKTAEVMRDGYYHTGDVASRDADGY